MAKRTRAHAHPGAWNSRGFLLWHGTLRWERQVNRVLEPIGFTYAQFSLLAGVWWLAASGTLPSQRELSDHTGIDPVMTSKIIRTLEERGLVERIAHDTDLRVRRLRLTPTGHRLALRALELVDEADEAFFGSVAPAATLVPILRRIARRDEGGRVTEPETLPPRRRNRRT